MFFFYFPIEINADTIDFSIKLEKDNKLAASGKALYIFVYQGSKLLWLIKRPDSGAFTTNIANLTGFSLLKSPI